MSCVRQEDDAAFWNRLVPVGERPEGEDAAELGVRAARLRAADEVRHSLTAVLFNSQAFFPSGDQGSGRQASKQRLRVQRSWAAARIRTADEVSNRVML